MNNAINPCQEQIALTIAGTTANKLAAQSSFIDYQSRRVKNSLPCVIDLEERQDWTCIGFAFVSRLAAGRVGNLDI